MVRLGNLTGLNQRREEAEEEEEEIMEAGRRDGSVRGQGAAGGAVDVGHAHCPNWGQTLAVRELHEPVMACVLPLSLIHI